MNVRKSQTQLKKGGNLFKKVIEIGIMDVEKQEKNTESPNLKKTFTFSLTN